MSPRTQTLSLIFIFLSVNVFVGCQFLPGSLSAIPEFYPNLKGPVTQYGKSLPDFLSIAKRLLAEYKQPVTTEAITETVITETAAIAVDPSNEEVPVVINPSSSVEFADNIDAPACTVPTVLPQPDVLPTEPLPIAAENTYQSVCPPQFEYTLEINQNILPFGPLQLETFPPSASLPETLGIDGTPIHLQIPSMPVINPFVALATPVPAMLPQNLPVSNCVPDMTQNLVNEQIAELASMVEAGPVVLTPNVVEPSCFPLLPFSIAINMPSPPSEPQIVVISANPTPPPQDINPQPSFPPMIPPPPVIVMKRSRSSWNRLLPILLIAMCGGGCGNSCGNCGCSGSNIPIPYPIPIPTNNPIINGYD